MTDTAANKIQPRPTSTSQPYWEGCSQGELRIQQCNDCNHYQFYPRIMCTECGSRDLSWQVSSGKGSVASYTVVRRGVSAAYPGPYVVALIDLTEGPRLMSEIVDVEIESPELRVGAPVAVTFERRNEEISVPVFHLT